MAQDGTQWRIVIFGMCGYHTEWKFLVSAHSERLYLLKYQYQYLFIQFNINIFVFYILSLRLENNLKVLYLLKLRPTAKATF